MRCNHRSWICLKQNLRSGAMGDLVSVRSAGGLIFASPSPHPYHPCLYRILAARRLLRRSLSHWSAVLNIEFVLCRLRSPRSAEGRRMWVRAGRVPYPGTRPPVHDLSTPKTIGILRKARKSLRFLHDLHDASHAVRSLETSWKIMSIFIYSAIMNAFRICHGLQHTYIAPSILTCLN